MLTRKQILQAQDMKFEDVDVPEWGDKVRVRVMRGADRDSLAAAIHNAAGEINSSRYQVRLLVRCLVGENGVPLFTEEDLDALNEKSTSALDRLFAVADRLNGVGSKAVDAAEKN